MITIYSPKLSNRFIYIVDLIFGQVLNVEYKIVDSDDLLGQVSINYSDKKISGCYHVKPDELLFSRDLFKGEIAHEFNDIDFIRLFSNNEDDHGFDVFSASFYLVSRMEEYTDVSRDAFSRFSSVQSILYKLNVLEKPIVNIWCKNLLNKLNSYYDSKIVLNVDFQQLNTIDIDNAYAYLHKGFLRTSAALVKSACLLKFKDFFQRIRVLNGKEKDPYDTYDYLLEFQRKGEITSYYFFLLGDYHKKDKNLSYKSTILQKLILRISKDAYVGIHPSFFSFLNHLQIEKEVSRLKKIINNEVRFSRNHFLRFSVPQTYHSLIDLGIKKDYTMGYSDAVGFRAGICSPFQFFDLSSDQVTDLQIIPFAYMDGVLRDHMNLDKQKAICIINELKNEVKSVNGCFVGIWHNESLSDQGRWIGWREVYESSFSSS